ncbi:type VI secretion system membrane subunit TssM [Tropicimonas sp. IMCC6043]|uniref:type VI secretion system membrane subunit TssM n=1 Tax=Tropicimonas sp. IMCC6043 TaxID=2510645 RepID=UPI00101CC2D6|nr:type VI secretion system membrane subunit TssM [Tropicimonas sp. IMCC6043]RYH09356.1 type VI secretion system membrane subunit TssM [Tropicimonas sp. IMCC6043]
MKAVLRFFISAYFVIFMVTLILSLTFWLLSPLIGGEEWQPFAGYLWRGIVVGVMWFIAILWIVILAIVRARRDKNLAEEIVESAAADVDPNDEIVQAELDEMKTKLRGAITQLRKSKMGRRHLYELPWYVIIGPPGAGKTTAIVNSGLRFPLTGEDGVQSIAGVGGTRNCDWWFTEDAVLLDTAGRYTTQESNSEADNAAWLGFLKMLRKYRARQPINGAVVAISLQDLSLQDEVTRQSHATAIRRRLSELREQLGVRFPVYVLFTKSDLIAGFTETFDQMGKEEREQVWGFTLPLDKSKGEHSPMTDFHEEFAALLERLNAQSLERMQVETNPARRSLIAGFAGQVSSVRQIAYDFLDEVFADSRYEQRHILRGVYFTSGTQEGNPIDRLMLGMAQTFGIGRQAIGSGKGTGRSYFLTRLFEGVVFPEAGLVSIDDKVARRYRWSRRIAIAASVLVVLAIGGLWTRSYLGNQALIADAAVRVEAYQESAALIPRSPIGDTDFPSIVPALNILRDVPVNPRTQDTDRPTSLGFGLYQGELVGNSTAQTYRAALNQHMLPRLILRLDEYMQASMNDPDRLYEALKVYLMLGQQGPVNKEQVMDWFQQDWEQFYAGAVREPLRLDLLGHLEALVDQPMQKVELNGHLIETVRGVISAMPQSDRIYTGILNSTAVRELPKWRLTDGNPMIGRAMKRSSGAGLGDGIDGVFTRCGFHDVFVPEALQVNEQLASEAWVLGAEAADQSEDFKTETTAGVFQLYYTDFVGKYEGVLADLDIIPLDSVERAVEVTNVLSSPSSPIANVLEAVANQTKLTEPCASADAAASAAGETIAGGALYELSYRLSYRQRVLKEAVEASFAAADGTGEARPLGTQVERRFTWLQDLTARPEGQPSELDSYLDLLKEVYLELNKLTIGGGAGDLLTNPTVQRFQQFASLKPDPVKRWSTQITTGSSGIGREGVRSKLNAEWTAKVLPLCQQALSNRYPFDRRAQADVAVQDFTRLFGPGQLIDGFFTENLSEFVDTNADPWSWRGGTGEDLGISPAVLKQFQNAAAIRDTFFATGQLGFNVQITPQALDPQAREMLLELNGAKVRAQRGGRPTPENVPWPGSVGLARLTVAPQLPNGESTITRDGPWSMFRLLDTGQIRGTPAPDRKRLIFRVGGRQVVLVMQLGSVNNPFGMAALSEFKCPTSF